MAQDLNEATIEELAIKILEAQEVGKTIFLTGAAIGATPVWMSEDGIALHTTSHPDTGAKLPGLNIGPLNIYGWIDWRRGTAMVPIARIRWLLSVMWNRKTVLLWEGLP